MMDMEKLGAALAPIVRSEIAKATAPLLARLADLEAREPLQGEPGEKGLDGKDGADGKDGVAPSPEDVAACFERRFSEFLMSADRRVYEMADKAIDRMPRAKDGRDGIGWDSMSVEFDGERTVTLVFDKGDEQFTYPVTFPVVLDKGFWKDGMAVEKGDGVTYGGSYWIAQKATESKPEVGSEDWRLAVKKGRDGKKQP